MNELKMSFFWIIVAFLSFLTSPSHGQSTDESVLSTTAIDDTSITVTVAPLINNSKNSNNTNSGSPSGWSTFLRKFFDRPSSQQKHADKNRIILEDLSANQANTDLTAVAFHDEETVAVIRYVDRNVESCKLMEVK